MILPLLLTWTCQFNSVRPMPVNIAWGEGGFAMRWQDGVANRYRYIGTPGVSDDDVGRVQDSLGGIWWFTFGTGGFHMVNPVNHNTIYCQR